MFWQDAKVCQSTFFVLLSIFDLWLNCVLTCVSTEPEKQFALVERHVTRIQTNPQFEYSEIVIMVERNL